MAAKKKSKVAKKKTAKKRSAPHARNRLDLPQVYKPEEPKPFSAHFHFEGRTQKELGENIRTTMGKHIGKALSE